MIIYIVKSLWIILLGVQTIEHWGFIQKTSWSKY